MRDNEPEGRGVNRRAPIACVFLSALSGRGRGLVIAWAATGLFAAAAWAGETTGKDEDVPTAPEVVVTATRTATPIEQVGSAITVITEDDIERRQPAFVEDVLRYVPGLDVSQTGGKGGFTQVRIRGAEANQTLVFIDGVEVNRPNFSNEFNFNFLGPEDIERIEVLRGPQSALYGSEAVGGVINIITKKGKGRPKASLTQEGGSFTTRNSVLNLSAGQDITGDLSYNASITGRTYHTDGISAAASGTETDAFDTDGGHAKLGLSYKDTLNVDLVGRWTRDEVNTDSTDFTAAGGAVDSFGQDNERQRYGRGQVRLNLFDGLWRQRAGVSATANVFESKNQSGATTFKTEGQKTVWDYQSVFNLETPSVLGAEHTLVVAYENEDDRADSNFQATQEVINNNAFFNYQLGLMDRLFLSGGAGIQESDFFPSVEVDDAFRFTGAYVHRETGTKIKGAYGKGVKNPTLFELFGATANFVGNPNLKPEQNKSWEVGIEQTLWDRKLKLEAVYFENDINNLIVGAGNTAENIAGSSIKGLELNFTVRPLENLDIGAAYTFSDTEQLSGEFKGDELVRRPAHKANLNVNYRFLGGRANVNLGILYNGEMKDFNFTSFTTRELVTLDDYVLVNVGGYYRLNENLKLFARIDNLLDDNYQEVFGFGQPGIGGFVGITGTL